ncbi:MAG: PilZ domain-containing protein [Deltaproteobacteria bacterium]|nr:PilZ domain-containing protein [Deltaproteobacteria bacterium]
MVDVERRKHERIAIEMPTRMWLEESYNGKAIVFEGFARSRDLAIGGTFLASNYLLPVGFPLNLEMRINDNEVLLARGEIVHSISEGDKHEPGMGIMLTEVDAENRERLLRFFVSARIQEFYGTRFLIEFPHLEAKLSLQDVALVINLWEDKEGRLTTLHRGDGGKARGSARRDEAAAAEKRKPKR